MIYSAIYVIWEITLLNKLRSQLTNFVQQSQNNQYFKTWSNCLGCEFGVYI